MAAELRLNVALDLQYFKAQLPKLSRAAAGFQLPIKVRFDGRQVQKELNRITGRREFRINLNDTSIKSAIANVKVLQKELAALERIKRGSTGAGVTTGGSTRQGTRGTFRQRLQEVDKAELAKLYEAAAIAGLAAFDQAIVNNKAKLITRLNQVGEDAVLGFINGIKSDDDGVRKAAESLGSQLLTSLRKKLKSQSPSREMFSIGEDAGKGFELGLLQALEAAERTSTRRMKRMLDKFARAVLMMSGMSAGDIRGQVSQSRALPGVNFPSSVPRGGVPIGPSSSGRALPPGANFPGLPGSSNLRAKYLPTDLGDELKKILRGAAYAFIDSLNQRIRRVSVSEIGPARLSPSRMAGFLPPAVGRGSALYGGPGDVVGRRVRQAYQRSAARSASVLSEGPQGFALGSGGSGPAGPFRPHAQGPGSAIVPYRAPIAPRSNLSGAYQGLGSFARGLSTVDSQLRQARLPLTGAIQDLGSEFGNAVKQVLLFGTAYKALSFVVDLPNQALAAATSLQTFRNQLEAVTGSAAAADQGFKFVDDLASRFNVPLDSARQGFIRLYASMAPAGFEPKQIEGLFTGISKAAATFGLSADKVDRVNYAFAQMASKGQLMSEELKGQLGDVLPGAVSLFAEAAQMSLADFTKAMEDGAFKGKALEQIFDNVAVLMNTKFAGAAAGASKTLQGRLNDLSNQTKKLYESFEPLVELFASRAFPALSNIIEDATSAIEAFGLKLQGVNPATGLMSSNAVAMYEAMVSLKSVAESSAEIIRALGGSFGFLGSVIGGTLKAFSAILANPIGQWFVKFAFYVAAATTALQLFARAGIISAVRGMVMFVRQMTAGVGAMKAFIVTSRAAKIAMGGLVAGGILVGLEMLVTHITKAKDETNKLKDAALFTADALRQMSFSQLLAEKRGQEAVLRATQQLREGYSRSAKPTAEQERLAGVAGLEVSGRQGQRRIDMSMVGAVEQQAQGRLAEIRHAMNQSGQGPGGGAATLQDIDLSADSDGGSGTSKTKASSAAVLAIENQILEVRKQLLLGAKGVNEFTLLDLELKLKLQKISEEDISAADKKLKKEQAEQDTLEEKAKIVADGAKKTLDQIAKEAKAREQINRLLLDAQLAAGAITQAEYDRKIQLMGQAAVLEQMRKSGATPEQIAQMEGLQAGTPAPGSVEELAKKAQDGLNDLINPVNQLDTIATGVGETFSTMFMDLATGAATAQEALGSMFDNLAGMFADMVQEIIAQWLKVQLIKGLGSIFGGMMGGGGGATSTASSGPNVDAIAMYMNANGNVLKGGFQAFANGGIVKGPTLGLVGEGRFNEAVVPLPDGRKIPVEMGKNMGGDVNSSVVVNINNSGNAQSSTKGAQGNQLAKGIEGAVKDVIMREMRPGGMIASRR